MRRQSVDDESHSGEWSCSVVCWYAAGTSVWFVRWQQGEQGETVAGCHFLKRPSSVVGDRVREVQVREWMWWLMVHTLNFTWRPDSRPLCDQESRLVCFEVMLHKWVLIHNDITYITDVMWDILSLTRNGTWLIVESTPNPMHDITSHRNVPARHSKECDWSITFCPFILLIHSSTKTRLHWTELKLKATDRAAVSLLDNGQNVSLQLQALFK